MLHSLSSLPPVYFHFLLLLFFLYPLQSTCLLLPAIFCYTQTIPFIILFSGKQSPLMCQTSFPFIFKLVLFHTSFILASHCLHLISSFMKYPPCLELILLPLILSHQIWTMFADSHVFIWFLMAIGHILMLCSDKSHTNLRPVGFFFFLCNCE